MVYCRSVKLLCREPPVVVPSYIHAKIGAEITPGCVVGYASPPSCVVAPSTRISVAEKVETRTRSLENNILVELRFASGGREVFIYPKHIWEEVESRFIEPLGKGEPPREGGAVLYGPPGTGKTSLARILTWMHGLYLVDVTPDSILSKWVGESEQRLRAKLGEAEAHEPSMVLFDDAEWMVRSRKTLSISEESAVYLGMLNILLRRVETWMRRRRLVVSIITTNVGEEEIDPALRRSGRLGRGIFVPLPDHEAVRILLEELGVPSGDAERLATKIVNAGLPMSDAASIAREVLAGREPRIRPAKGRGYLRPVPPGLDQRLLDVLSKYYGALCPALTWGTRIWLTTTSTVSIPLAVTIVGLLCKKPAVLLVDQRFFDEAITTADTNNATLIVSHDYMSRDVAMLIHAKARSPVVFCGSEPPPVPSLPRSVSYGIPALREALLKTVLGFYEIEHDQHDVRDALRLAEDAFERLVKSIGVFHAPLRETRRVVVG